MPPINKNNTLTRILFEHIFQKKDLNMGRNDVHNSGGC